MTVNTTNLSFSGNGTSSNPTGFLDDSFIKVALVCAYSTVFALCVFGEYIVWFLNVFYYSMYMFIFRHFMICRCCIILIIEKIRSGVIIQTQEFVFLSCIIVVPYFIKDITL